MCFLGYGSYHQYEKYQSRQNFQKDVFDKSRFRKVSLYEVHQNIAFKVDPVLEAYERKKNILSLRKELISNAKGFILETAVGTSRNLIFYPEGSKVIGTDWASNMLEVALNKVVPKGVQIDYKIEDTERMTFIDNVFDTVVDTFGLEAYVNPEKALEEMRRVCKKDGKILILTSGLGYNSFLNKILHLRVEQFLKSYGYAPNRDWNAVIKKMNFDVEMESRWFNGTIYLYILRNNK